MPYLQVLRHAPTKKDAQRGSGSSLSAEGVALARRLGDRYSHRFDRVITSTIPRTLETALAMGYAVDACHEELGLLTAAFWAAVPRHGHWEWDRPFDEYRQLAARDGPLRTLGRAQVEVWSAALQRLPAESAVLVVSHGHVMEAGLTCAVGEDVIDGGERPFAHCEGFRLDYHDGHFRELRWLRNPNDA